MLFPEIKRGVGVGVVLGIHLALFVPPAQSWGGWDVISWNTQSPLHMMAAHSAVTTPYERIRMSYFPDADLAYPLIAAYLQTPELAHSVREFISDLGGAHLAGLHDPGADRLPFAVSDSDHVAIRNHVDVLDFPPETTQKMKDSLDWWRETGKARHSQPAPDPEAPTFCGNGARNDEDERLYDFYAATAAALLLSLCPNITTLYLGGVRDPLEEYLLRSNYGLTSLPALQRLQHIEHYGAGIRRWDDTYDTVQLLDQFRYFHRLPQIVSVSMEGVMEYQANRETFPPKTSQAIKKIHLGHSDISGIMLATIIRIPTGLEEVSVSLGGLFHRDGGSPSVDIGLLGRSLDQHKSTLQVLDIDLGDGIDGWMYTSGREEDYGYEDEDEDYEEYQRDDYFYIDDASSEGPLRPRDVEKLPHHDGKIMVFRDYTALKRLSVNVQAIIGPTKQDFIDIYTTPKHRLVRQPPFRLIDALPPSLEYLCLYGYQRGEVPEVDEYVIELIEKRYTRLPNLREIRGVDTIEHAVVIDEDDGEDDDQRGYWKRPDVSLEWVEA